jgi:ketosteroid isomerase-like protein
MANASEDLSLAALHARLRRLEDIEEIRDLRRCYHWFINDALFERMAEIYTADGIVDMGPLVHVQGTRAIVDFYLSVPRNVDFVIQYIHNHIVEVDGDLATGLSYFDARYAQDGESVIVAARLDERYRRTADGWRIAETLVHVYFGVPVTKGWANAMPNSLKPLR